MYILVDRSLYVVLVGIYMQIRAGALIQGYCFSKPSKLWRLNRSSDSSFIPG